MKTQTLKVIIVIAHLLCRNVSRLNLRIKVIEVDVIERYDWPYEIQRKGKP